MAWENMVQSVLGNCTGTFGRDDITHAPDNFPIQAIRGIWSEIYLSADPETGMPISTSDPNIGVRLSDFSAQPKKNDRIYKGTVEYRIRSVEADGEGGATLVLEKVKT